jgi:hypothetical protein
LVYVVFSLEVRTRSVCGVIHNHWLITSLIRRVTQQARGPALPIVRGMAEQIPQFVSAGMSVEEACRESLLLAIRSAQIKAQYCVGTERFALDDFISVCSNMEALTKHLARD